MHFDSHTISIFQGWGRVVLSVWSVAFSQYDFDRILVYFRAVSPTVTIIYHSLTTSKNYYIILILICHNISHLLLVIIVVPISWREARSTIRDKNYIRIALWVSFFIFVHFFIGLIFSKLDCTPDNKKVMWVGISIFQEFTAENLLHFLTHYNNVSASCAMNRDNCLSRTCTIHHTWNTAASVLSA